MVSRLSSIAFWALALCFLFFAVLSNASDTPRHPHAKRGDLVFDQAGSSDGGSDDNDDGSPLPDLPDLEGLTRRQALDQLMEDEMLECISDYEKVEDQARLCQLGDHTQWAQTLLYDLFKDVKNKEVKKEDFSCDAPGYKCYLARSCEDFNAIGKGGLYYMFLSLESYFTWFSQLSSELDQQLSSISDKSVGTMRKALRITGSPPGSLDVLDILATAFSVASGPTAPLAPISGYFAGTAGLLSLFGATVGSGESTNDDPIDAEDFIRGLIGDTRDEGLKQIKNLISGVFGYGVAQSEIPEAMLVGDSRYENPVVRVFGWGGWVRSVTLRGMEEFVGNIRANMDKGLFWQMARLWRGIYVVVRDDLPSDKCTHPNNAWDDEKGRCLDVLAWYPKKVGQTLGGNKDIEYAWSDWDMDKLRTLRNAVSCWEDNGGHVGKPDTSIGSLKSKDPYDLHCFFTVPVLKGKHSDVGKGSIWMAGDFAGQDGQADKLWPKSKCEQGNRDENQNPFSNKKDYACADFDLTPDLM